MQHAPVLTRPPAVADIAEAAAYRAYLAHLLRNEPPAAWRWQFISTEADWHEMRSTVTAALDLLVCVEAERPWWRQILPNGPTQWLVAQAPSSLLLVRQPRWPLRHVLLIVRGEETDDLALDWVLWLAGQDHAHVTILPIVPPWPGLYRLSRSVQPAPEVLLSPCTPPGARLARLVRLLHRRHIPAVLSLHRGEPDQQIQTALAAGDPDLVVIAAESHHRLLRLLCGELVAPLLRWLDRPLLIAKEA
jgi:nucleotide-binding universal stress UspA family protein